MTSLSNYQRQVRSFQFREQIAVLDLNTPGVFELSWQEARNAWRNATRIARSYPLKPRSNNLEAQRIRAVWNWRRSLERWEASR